MSRDAEPSSGENGAPPVALPSDATSPPVASTPDSSPPEPPPVERFSRHWWETLRKRKAWQWSLAYIVVAFGVLQGAALVADLMGWPTTVGRVTLVLLLCGFAITLFIAWRHGDQGHQRVTHLEAGIVAACVACGLLLSVVVSRSPDSITRLTPATSARLAVLRFENLGDAPPHFAEVLADELISEMSHVDGVGVTARASSFALEGDRATPAAASRELGATLVLTGSVRRAGDDIRVHTQLSEAPGGRQIWQGTFEAPSSSIFVLQRDIAVQIARAMGLRFDPDQAPRRVDPDVLSDYFRARELWDKRASESEIITARDLLRSVVERDPRFADAWAWLSYLELDGITTQLQREQRRSTEADFAPAIHAASRAIALNPRLHLPYRTREFAFAELGRWRDAYDAGSAAESRGGLPWVSRLSTGQLRVLIEPTQLAADLDPFNHSQLTNLSNLCYDAEETACARLSAERALEVAPSGGYAVASLFFALRQAGDDAAARRLFTQHADAWTALYADSHNLESDAIRSLNGDGPPPSASALSEAVRRGELSAWGAILLLASTGRGEEAAPLFSHWKAGTDLAGLSFLYGTDLAAVRRLPEFWALMDREGLLRYWRDSGRWPDFCEREHVCESYR